MNPRHFGLGAASSAPQHFHLAREAVRYTALAHGSAGVKVGLTSRSKLKLSSLVMGILHVYSYFGPGSRVSVRASEASAGSIKLRTKRARRRTLAKTELYPKASFLLSQARGGPWIPPRGPTLLAHVQSICIRRIFTYSGLEPNLSNDSNLWELQCSGMSQSCKYTEASKLHLGILRYAVLNPESCPKRKA